jgi:DNA-binding SARP family transcriptional activator
VRFALLGPLELTDDAGAQVTVAGRRLRVLLAALVLHANEPVSLDALAEAVWDGVASPKAAETLRSHVRRLRHALGPQAGALIAAHDPGYLIRLAEPELDVLEFEALCRKAASAARAEAWSEVSQAAAQALALWRGTPLLDVSSQVLRDGFVPRLEQLRLQALEDGMEADLQLGHHARLIVELRELTARHPLRERFHAQLILALARTGRQAEALDAYRLARRELVEELGIEPGPELRQLQERILAGDVELVTSSPVAPAFAPAAAPPTPRQLPAAVRHFTGRRAELDALLAVAAEAARDAATGGTVVISAIDGMAGIGKTALAVHAAHQLAEKFPDGQLFIDLHGYTQGYAPRSAGDVLDWLLRTLGVPPQRIPQDADERAALYRQQLADTRTLILLDNAADEAQVRPLLPGSAGSLALITSRRRLKGLDDAYPLPLDVLPQADAITLLRTVAGRQRTAADDPVLAEIAELCGKLPLALRIAGALLRHRPTWSPEHLAEPLRDQQRRIGALSDGERDLGAVFDLSYQALADNQQLLFRHLGLIPGPDIDAYATAALIDTDPARAEQLLQELVEHNLLAEPTLGRYQMHDLVRAHAQAAHNPGDQSDGAVGRLLDYFQHTAARADTLIARYTRPDPAGAPIHSPALPDPETARTWLRTERANLLACLQRTATHAQHARTITLTAGLASLLRTDGPWPQAITLHTAAAAAAEHLGDQRVHAAALTELGYLRAMTGDFPGAIRDLQAALKDSRESGNWPGQAGALTELGNVRTLTGDFPGAIRDLQAALDIFRETGDRNGHATALARLGYVRMVTGDFPGAIRDLQAALKDSRESGNRSGQASALTRLGEVRRLTGDLPGATRDLEQALGISRETGDRNAQATSLLRLGSVRQASGDLPGAARDLEQALGKFREIGARNDQAIALGELGVVRRTAGDLPGAACDLRQALDIFREIGARSNQAWALNKYAATVAAAGDPAEARALYDEALHLADETNLQDEQALALEGLGEFHVHVGETQAATTHLKQALDIFLRLAMKLDSDRVQARLGQLGRPPGD